MTVSSTTSKNTYSGDGSTTVFAYTFRILVNTDIAVQSKDNTTGVITTKILGTDYTVSNVGASSGGNVTFVTAPASGTTIILIRSISILQPVHLSEYDPFASVTVETEFDRLTMISQQINELIGRGLVLDPTVTGYSNTIGSPTPGYVIRANSGGTGFEFAAPLGTSGYTFGSGTGILVQSVNGTTALVRTLTGTANEITVTNGSGVSGAPTFSLPSALTFTSKTVTGGTFTSPTLTTPSLGVATAASINKVVFTQPAAGATLTIANNKTLTVSDDATVSGSSSGTNTGDQTGTILQNLVTEQSSVSQHSVNIPDDDTIPQNTEGEQILSQAITPASASSILEIEVSVPMSVNTTSTTLIAALFQDSTASALKAGAVFESVSGQQVWASFKHKMTAGSTSPTTFKVRVGPSTANTLTVNGSGGVRRLGGAQVAYLRVKEIKA